MFELNWEYVTTMSLHQFASHLSSIEFELNLVKFEFYSIQIQFQWIVACYAIQYFLWNLISIFFPHHFIVISNV
jgi:hypothetical protein